MFYTGRMATLIMPTDNEELRRGFPGTVMSVRPRDVDHECVDCRVKNIEVGSANALLVDGLKGWLAGGGC